MRLEQRFRFNTVASASLVLIIIGISFVAIVKFRTALETSKISDAILATSFERLMLRTDVHRTGSERSKRQLIAKHKQVLELLKVASLKFEKAEDKQMVAELVALNESIGKLSKTIRENREKHKPQTSPRPISENIEVRLLSQLNMRVYEALFLCRKLQESSKDALYSSVLLGGGGVFLMLLLVTVMTTTNSVMMSRSIGARIKKFRDGAAVIGNGNLGHELDIAGDDELAELGSAFNQMTADLQQSYQYLHHEVEERKRTEAALRESEVRLSLALRSAGMGVWSLDFITGKRIYDEQTCRCLGIDTATFTGRPEEFYAVIHPDDISTITAALERSAVEGAPYSVEYRAAWSDGSIHHLAARGRPVIDESGKTLRLEGLVWDVTDLTRAREELQQLNDELESRVKERTEELIAVTENLKREIGERQWAEQLLRQSEERFRKIFEEGPLAAIIADEGCSFIKVNSQLCKLLGYSSQELLSDRTFFDLTYPADQKIHRQHMDSLLAGCVHDFSLDSRFRHKNGDIIWGTLTAWVMRDCDGNALHFIATIEDITDRKKLQKQLLLSAKQEEREKSRKAILAHQERLRTLAAKLSVAQEEERRRIATEVHDGLGQSLAFCKIKLGELIDEHQGVAAELLEVRNTIENCLSRTRTLSFELSPAVLYDVGLEPAVQWLRRLYRQRYDLEVTVLEENVAAEIPLPLRIILFQAVRELLMNVAKHSRGTRADVVISGHRRLVSVCVSDNGIGYRNPAKSELTGFGLFNIQEQLRNVGGMLDLGEAPGGGTMVTATVPLAAKKRSRK